MAILKINIVTNGAGAAGGINQTSGALGKLGTVGKVAGAGIVAIGAGLAVLGKDAYRAASSVQQSFGALESVFGKAAGQSKAWAASAANDVGLAKSEYANLAVVLGSQLGNMGRSQAEAATETNKLIGLGADLAATFGGSVADAVSAVSGVLKGETDPIERYGISIKAADINARLAADGLDKLTGKELKAATATAALTLLTEQSTAAQGAFGRETNTAGGQQERMRANVENLKASLGAGLLPVMTALFGFLNTQAFPAAAQLGGELRERLGPAVAGVGRFISGTLVPAARSFYSWFVERIVPGIRGFVMPIIDALRARFTSVSATLDSNSGNLSKVRDFLRLVAEAAAKLAPVIGTLLGGAIRASTTVITTMITAVSKVVGVIDSLISKLKSVIDLAKRLPDVGGLLGKLNPFAASALAGASPSFTTRAAPLAGLARISTASSGSPGFGIFTTSAAGGAGATVDARTFVNVAVSGAIDPVSTARTIRDLLRGEDVRLGRVTTYAPAGGGWAA